VSDRKRPYVKQRRAEAEAATRLRITESAVALHGELGPARTSISAIAERAGVRRSTVYRHFADEADILGACSAHWASRHPPPDPAGWERLTDPRDRLETALSSLYAYHRCTAPMISKVLRDLELVPELAQTSAGYVAYFERVRDGLLRGHRARGAGRTRLRAAIGHAIAFTTWRSLTEQGLDDDEAAQVAAAFAVAAGGGVGPR
jgi:AcrR family transcriptional regulator